MAVDLVITFPTAVLRLAVDLVIAFPTAAFRLAVDLFITSPEQRPGSAGPFPRRPPPPLSTWPGSERPLPPAGLRKAGTPCRRPSPGTTPPFVRLFVHMDKYFGASHKSRHTQHSCIMLHLRLGKNQKRYMINLSFGTVVEYTRYAILLFSHNSFFSISMSPTARQWSCTDDEGRGGACRP